MRKVYTQIEQIAGNVVTVLAENVAYGEIAVISSKNSKSFAQVIRLEGSRVSLQVLAGTRGIAKHSEVRFLGHTVRTSCSKSLIGRFFTRGGEPRDGGPVITENLIDIGGPSVNPAKRIIPRKMIRTGIPMIDVFNTLVESQKLPIPCLTTPDTLPRGSFI